MILKKFSKNLESFLEGEYFLIKLGKKILKI